MVNKNEGIVEQISECNRELENNDTRGTEKEIGREGGRKRERERERERERRRNRRRRIDG